MPWIIAVQDTVFFLRRARGRAVRGLQAGLVLAGFLAWGLLASAVPAAGADDSVSGGGTLRVIAHADLRTLDPIWTTAYITRNHGYMIYDTLFAMDSAWTPQPQMVENWTVSADGLRWRFRLREGLAWHDGAPVTAADCVASLERWWRRDSFGQKLAEAAEGLSVEDARAFALVLREPFPVLEALAKISSNVPFMMPERVARLASDEAVTEAIGSGPYRFVAEEWQPGVRAVYARFEGYRPRSEPASNAAGGKRASFERVEWHYVPDPNAALAGLRAGDYDLWEQVPSDLAPAIEEISGLALAITDTLGYQGMLRFNHLQPPFDDARARRAAVRALERTSLLRAAAGARRFWRPCESLFPCGTPFASETGLAGARYDPEAARALLRDSSYDGRAIALLHPTDIPALSAFAQVAAEQLRAVGFSVRLEAMDWAALAQRRAERGPPESGGWNLFPTAWVGADVVNPALAAALNASGEDAWFGWPEDEELERLRADFLRAPDPQSRRAAAFAVQGRALEVATHANLGTYFIPMAWRRARLGDGLIPAPVPFFWGVSSH